MSDLTLYLGEIWHTPDRTTLAAHRRGALAVDRDGRIAACGDADTVRARHAGARVVDFGDALLLPGFVDAHVHFPQLDMIGAYGKGLLDWLQHYTYPAEEAFADPAVAAAAADRFLTELLANGTTLACVYSSVHEHAARALFTAAQRRGLRLVVGKASMDRNAPPSLLQAAPDDLAANGRLIRDWHGKDGRLFVALTPRFAVSCTPELMAGLGRLKADHPDVYVQSHHAETKEEVRTVHALFPDAESYLAVYDRFGLVGDRTVLGHGIHATDAEMELYVRRHCAVAHCPTSNLFLGSGLFPFRRFVSRGVKVALGTDVGAGTSFSLLKTIEAAYEVAHVQGASLEPAELLYAATLGGASALGLDGETGSFAPGKHADFQVLDWRRSRLLAHRFAAPAPADARVLALACLGDDRLVRAVYVGGREAHAAQS